MERHVHPNGSPQARHAGLRFAFSVPQESQRLYIFRANQLVMMALAMSMTASTSRLSRASLKSGRPRPLACDTPAHARNLF